MFSSKKGVCLNLGRLVTLMRHRECLMLTEHHVNWCIMSWRGSVNSFFKHTIEFFLTKIVLRSPMAKYQIRLGSGCFWFHTRHSPWIHQTSPRPSRWLIVFGIRGALSFRKMWKMWPHAYEPLVNEWLSEIWQFHCLASRRHRLLTSGVMAV